MLPGSQRNQSGPGSLADRQRSVVFEFADAQRRIADLVSYFNKS